LQLKIPISFIVILKIPSCRDDWPYPKMMAMYVKDASGQDERVRQAEAARQKAAEEEEARKKAAEEEEARKQAATDDKSSSS
jgi:hypothetical protein